MSDGECPRGRKGGCFRCRKNLGTRWSMMPDELDCVPEEQFRITDWEKRLIDQGGIDALVDTINATWPHRYIREFNLRMRAFEANGWLEYDDRIFAIYLMMRPGVNEALAGQARREERQSQIVEYITEARLRGETAKQIDRHVYENFAGVRYRMTLREARRWRQAVDKRLAEGPKELKQEPPENVVQLHPRKKDRPM